ncbi:hypothetical protein ABEB36_005848 [Hypothenemus hampei]|uniref:Condensin-2 complex subunit H2 C-terminal domain-containing protein n=1 Tax=Hypothenemus hampei TaxID=57062 RepID=A0ABD1EZL9_HYPHA
MKKQTLNMEDEDELINLDYKSPKGKLIKLLEQKIKKPEIDDTLEKVLIQFSQITLQQTMCLENGVLNVNFAEDALLLQICGQYYAKRVDMLWNELLQFQTRMVTYDNERAKQCTDSAKQKARKQELARLEERLNRGKRKKICLTETGLAPTSTNEHHIFNIDQSDISDLFGSTYKFPFAEKKGKPEEQHAIPFQRDNELVDEWRKLLVRTENDRKYCNNSQFVAQYHQLRSRFKYYTNANSTAIIYDLSDPSECNTREGKLICSHHIKNIFHDNDWCLMPDENFKIAKLRLQYYLRKKWFKNKEIDPNDPNESYKDELEAYEKEFFRNECRKIHNMPQKTPEELLLFYEALAKKEELALKQVEQLRAQGVTNLPIVNFETVIVEPNKEDYNGIFDPYIPEGIDTLTTVTDVSSNEKLRFPTIDEHDGDHEAELSSLLENFSKDSSNENSNTADTNLRADSGYFDGSFADDESEHDDYQNGRETPSEFNQEIETEIVQDNEENYERMECSENSSNLNNITVVEKEMFIRCERMPEMREAIEMFASQGTSNQDLTKKVLEDSYFLKTDTMIGIVYNKTNNAETNRFFNNVKQIAESEKRRKKPEGEKETTRKKRKLSRKQIEKLKQSLIRPVNELKWEHFFSMNYQTEIGEGEVVRVDYDSDMETEEEDMDLDSNGNNEQEEFNCSLDLNEPLNDTDEMMPLDSGINMDCSLNDSQFGDTFNSSLNISDQIELNAANSTQNVLEESLGNSQNEQASYLADMEKMKARVADWQNYILPKLKQLDENDFDIHEYGAKILNKVNVNESKPFSDIVGGQSASEVVRYFVSGLQLANTMNVEISGVNKGKLSNDSLSLKLLNRERYYEHLGGYHAPSEKNLEANLMKLKKTQKQNKVQKQGRKRKRSEDIRSQQPSPKINKHVKDQQLHYQERYQQPSTSWQADLIDQEEAVRQAAETPSRISIDSGFVPTCDEDFVEQFDQLQQFNDDQLRSTPTYPSRIGKKRSRDSFYLNDR